MAQGTCVYDEVVGPGIAPTNVGINLAPYTIGGAQEFSASLDAYPVGDDAFWTGAQLYVLRGDFYLYVHMYTPDPEAVRLESAKALAQIVLTRLSEDDSSLPRDLPAAPALPSGNGGGG